MNKISLLTLWAGIVLLVVGVTLIFFGIAYTMWAIGAMLSGSLGILVYVFINYERVKDFLIEYSTRQWANKVICFLVLMGVVISVQILADTHNYRFDLTPDGRLSLPSTTKKVLLEAAYPIKAIGFHSRDERLFLYDLFEKYGLASDKFTYKLYNFDRNPGLAEKYGVRTQLMGLEGAGTAVILVNGKVKKITHPTEEKIANAILNLTSPVKKVIYFATGHGEHPLEGLKEDKASYGLLKQVLEKENYLVKTLLLVGGKPVPDDASLVIVGGPQTGFSPEDVKSLDSYIKKGGKVIIAVDPGYEDGLIGMLKEYGVILGDDLVVDTEDYLIEENPTVTIIPFYMTHPITENFSIPTVFPLARSVTKNDVGMKGVDLKSLAKSGEKSWAETDVKAAEGGKYEYNPWLDQKGPITVAMVGQITVVATSEEKPHAKGDPGDEPKNQVTEGKTPAESNPSMAGRMIVFGDSDFLLNHYFELRGNKDLFINCVHWMTDDESLISIPKKQHSAEQTAPMFISPISARMIFIGSVILLPIIVAVIGIVVAWRRRQRG